MNRRVFIFDAYGTLFDVNSAVTRYSDEVGEDASLLADIWRVKQLEYSWVRSLMGAYQDFWQLTEQALDFALEKVPTVDPALRDKLLSAYQTLEAYPEVPAGLLTLKQQGLKTAILSNGSPLMLEQAVRNAGLTDLLDEVFSIDQLAIFKTCPECYQMVLDHFNCSSEDVLFHSSNRWDIAGAKAFGFSSHWINRMNVPDEYLDLPPDKVWQNLSHLSQAV